MLVGRVLCAMDAHGIAKRLRAGRRVDEWEWAIGGKNRGT
jgi:hypothetical protein